MRPKELLFAFAVDMAAVNNCHGFFLSFVDEVLKRLKRNSWGRVGESKVLPDIHMDSVDIQASLAVDRSQLPQRVSTRRAASAGCQNVSLL